jgi:O-antigen ligase
MAGVADSGCDRLASLLAGAIVLTVFFLPLSESLKNIAYVVALVAYLALIIIGGRGEIVMPPVGWFFLASLGVAIASALASAHARQAWRGVWEIFRYTGFFFSSVAGSGSEMDLGLLVAAVAGGGLAASVMVGRVLVSGYTIHDFKMFSLGNKNAVAQYLVMMLAMMLGMADRLQVARVGATLLAVGAGSSLVLLGLSTARTIWAALVVTVVVMVGWRRPRVVVPALGLLVIVVVGATLAQPEVARRVTALSHAGTYLDVGERTDIWRWAVSLWRDHRGWRRSPDLRLYAARRETRLGRGTPSRRTDLFAGAQYLAARRGRDGHTGSRDHGRVGRGHVSLAGEAPKTVRRRAAWGGMGRRCRGPCCDPGRRSDGARDRL